MALNSADVKKLLQDHDLGLLIVRIAIGGAMMAYGVPKFMHGGEYLSKVGESMGYLGLHFAPLFWGFLAALTEVMGGFMILAGFLFRPAAFFLVFTMVVATVAQAHQVVHGAEGKDFVTLAMHPLSYAGIFLGLLFAGPGKWSIQKH